MIATEWRIIEVSGMTQGCKMSRELIEFGKTIGMTMAIPDPRNYIDSPLKSIIPINGNQVLD